MSINYSKLSKIVSHALRHKPSLYNLNLDSEGWVDIDKLIQSLGKKDSIWSPLSKNDLQKMIEFSSKKRHEVKGNKIRALYGHSLDTKIIYQEIIPPDILYHGTSSKASKLILAEGLMPMSRQYVHLSVDKETAIAVGLRKSKTPAILIVDSKNAHIAGVKFYQGGDKIFLSAGVPSNFIKLNNQ